MSLWWARRDQLDETQVRLIEELDLEGRYLVLGPPGSGKTNVLLRRAQFSRLQGLPNVMVLTFTRSLTEFLKTGCYNSSGDEIFPPTLISTLERWVRDTFRGTGVEPPFHDDFTTRKTLLAEAALDLVRSGRLPKFDALFVDEAQDLLPSEVALIEARADRLLFVGDDRQKIHDGPNGLVSVRALTPRVVEEVLPFHYRLAPEICAMADRILSNVAGGSLAATSHYNGPRPGRVDFHPFADRDMLVEGALNSLRAQLRAYGDMIAQGDKLGVVVPKKADRDVVFAAAEADEQLSGRTQIVRARTGDADDRGYNPALDPACPILIMTEQACKGLEFRALHWLFADEAAYHRTDERYYTVITRAKTSLDIYHTGQLPQTLARSHAGQSGDIWQ